MACFYLRDSVSVACAAAAVYLLERHGSPRVWELAWPQVAIARVWQSVSQPAVPAGERIAGLASKLAGGCFLAGARRADSVERGDPQGRSGPAESLVVREDSRAPAECRK